MFEQIETVYLNDSGRLIDKKKYEDLLLLLRYVPEPNHDFYKNLRCSNDVEDYGMASRFKSDFFFF